MKDPHRPWAMWRRIWYGTGFASFWLCVGLLIYFTNYYQPPNCFDGILNGEEVQTDAGGPCVRIPQSQVLVPQVAWAESFEVTPGRYNAVAYIEHRDLVAGTAALPYTFTFFAGDGSVLAQRSGETALAPNSTLPLFESMVTTDQPIAQTTVTIDPATVWVPLSDTSGPFRTVDTNLQDEDTRPRLLATIENQDLESAQEVEVVATIFNDLGVPVTASETFIERFPGRATQQAIFTWPQPIGKTVRSCSLPTDVMVGIDVSGSMNNDGDTPPQPLTDAVVAASSFITNLGILDQVGVVTFATGATLLSQLTQGHTAVAGAVTALTITPEEEVGFTNTASALQFAQAELTSPRHNQTAQRAFVLLTDGLPTATGDVDAEAQALAAAADLRTTGVDLYVIGLGAGVNQDFITALAGDQTRAYLAPSRTDLGDIYATITASLCEVGPTKIEVIAKPPLTFAPLR